MQKLIDTKTYGPDEEMAKRLLQAAKDKKLDDNLRSMLAPVAQSEGAREVQRGFALMQKGKLDEAKQCFDHAMELNPDDPNVLNGVGWYRINNADVPGAQQLFEKALEAQPANLGAMNGLATCYKRMGKVDEAIELWKKMMEQYPGANAGAYSLGETYLEREEFAKALPIFEQLAKQWPENESVQQALARAREGSKK